MIRNIAFVLALFSTAVTLSKCALGEASAFDGKVYETQYGGPPMWDRGPNPEYRRERPTFRPRPYGPQMEPCIYRGDCRGPGYRLPPYRYPPRYDLYGDD